MQHAICHAVQVLQAAEPPEEVWAGVSGQISQLMAEVDETGGEFKSTRAHLNDKEELLRAAEEAAASKEAEIAEMRQARRSLDRIDHRNDRSA